MPGTNTSAAEITNVTSRGVWLCVLDCEYFLAYADYPWFKNATIAQLLEVELWHGHHLHWPALDVDLELAALANPEAYPLIAAAPRPPARPRTRKQTLSQ